MTNKRILIISHNAMRDDTNNGRTLLQLFKDYSKENLAQLFLYKENPNVGFCDRFYRITDFDVVHSIIKLGKCGGAVITNEEAELSVEERKVMSTGSKDIPLLTAGRNFIWSLNTWWIKDLKNWLKEFNPDVIFFYGSNYRFCERLVMKIAKFLQIPIVTYWVDDYYVNALATNSLLGAINTALYKHTTKKLMKKSEFIALNEMMKKEYEKTFQKKGNVIYTTSELLPFADKAIGKKLIMSFIGNISLKRYENLIDIANCITENALPIEFNVYSAETREWILDKLQNINGLNFKGSVPYEKTLSIMERSDILVHVESFDSETVRRVMFSLSTKIADSLCSNRCLFAYGPKNVASMNYLIENNCAITVCDREELEKKLKLIVNNDKLLKNTAAKALQTAAANHSAEKNHKKLYQILGD